VGTPVAQGKETRAFFRPFEDTKAMNRAPAGGAVASGPAQRDYVMETGLFADLALVKAHTADTDGNLVFRKTARNFNPMMATAANFVIAECEVLVPAGQLDPDQVHTPGSYIDRIVQTVSEKRIEQRTVRKG
jgi:acyl CoA:acetate/3-ketoacid CoA transferase alpha subunit